MKNLILILVILNLYFLSLGQISAITQDGQKVILFNNYTWKYANDEYNHSRVSGITRIEVGFDGLVNVEFKINGHRMSFFDGKSFLDDLQPRKIEYHQNSFFEKSVGKIKQISFDDVSVFFEYHQNNIFKKSEGKISTITFGNQSFQFEYYQNSFFEKSEGKLKSISSGMNSVEFKYFENTAFPATLGKLEEIKGDIPGVKIRYME